MANIETKPQLNSSAVKHVLPTVPAKPQITPFPKTHRLFKGAQITLRLVAIVATLTAMLCMLTSHQSAVILGMKFDARYNYSPAFKFFVSTNAIACFFILVTLFPAFIIYRKGSYPSSCYCLMLLSDIVMLVIAGCATATAIGDVGLHGNPHTGWAPICSHFTKFCSRVTSSLILSYISAVSLLILAAMSAISSKERF